MEIEKFKALDFDSYMAGYEEGKKHANEESYAHGFETALRLMEKGYQDAKKYCDKLLGDSKNIK